MENCIIGAKNLIEAQVKENHIGNIGRAFYEFQKVYSWTNENINAYLSLADFKDKTNALSVMASGDHLFNLVVNGIQNIDAFDTNRLTEYYALGFKRAMILKYDYQTFIEKMSLISNANATIEEISDLILGLLPFMENKYAAYWKTIVDFNFCIQKRYGTNLNLFSLISFVNNCDDISFYNNYLVDEAHYEELRQNLGRTNISFKCVNAVDLANVYSGLQYDFILLSNILDYFAPLWNMNWDYAHLKKYEEELEKIIAFGGTIFLNYIFNYGVIGGYLRRSIIRNSKVKINDLTDEEVHKLSFWSDTNVFDGMVLKRVP